MQPKSEENPCHTSNVEFLNVDLQGPDAGIQRRYNLRYAMIRVDSRDPSSYSVIRQPLDTPIFADEVKEGKNNKEITQTSRSAALKASVTNPFGVNLSLGRNDGMEVGTISEWTRFRKQIIGWNEENTAKWTYFGSDKGFLGSLKLPSNSLDLPIVDFHHPGQKNEGTPPMDMTVKVSSLWVTEVDGVKNEGTSVGDRETSRFSNFPRYFPRKKVELVPIYTNIVPCVVIDFQTEALSGWNFIRKKLLLPVGADTTIEQPGEEDSEVGEESVRVIYHRPIEFRWRRGRWSCLIVGKIPISISVPDSPISADVSAGRHISTGDTQVTHHMGAMPSWGQRHLPAYLLIRTISNIPINHSLASPPYTSSRTFFPFAEGGKDASDSSLRPQSKRLVGIIKGQR